ncbi:MAG TPA: hypothetical protein VHZ50_17680 [Puia sp.]|jgi:hypothetical protein|nr:hypothetical protein [Puia sp.]
MDNDVLEQIVPLDLTKNTNLSFISTSSVKTFDPDAFQKSFLWPEVVVKKKKVQLCKERTEYNKRGDIKNEKGR